MMEQGEQTLVGYIFDALPYLATGFLGLSTFVLRGATAKMTSVDNRLESQHVRLVAIEANYVSRDDLEIVLRELQNDLKSSFDRAHSRIDQLYQHPKD